MVLSWHAFSFYWFVMFPAACLCLQYGWDLIVDDIVPVKHEEE